MKAESVDLGSWVVLAMGDIMLRIIEALSRHRKAKNRILRFKLHHLRFLFFDVTTLSLTSENLKAVKH